MRRSGLTILELMVVVVICGTLSAIAVPRLLSLRNASAVRSAVSEVAAAFSLARQTAVARRATVAVVLDTSTGTVIVRSGIQIFAKRRLSSVYTVSLGANRDSAVYDPRGMGYGVSNMTITIRRGSFVDTLTMSRLGRLTW